MKAHRKIRRFRSRDRLIGMICAGVVTAALTYGHVQSCAAQEKRSINPNPLPSLTNLLDPMTPAKELFGRVTGPAPLNSEPIGSYSKGCLAGGEALPITGPYWQVMRLSRNRNWGHPTLNSFLKRFASAAAHAASWNGILIGDLSQPRGGPMLTGHASHQVGLDVDVWLTPMPDHELTAVEREGMAATVVVRNDRLDIDPRVWTQGHIAVIRAAAEDATVQRVFVNAAIKRALCRSAAGQIWMSKVRPWWGHDDHFHIRLYCPNGSEKCKDQEPVPPGDGCDSSLDWWFTDEAMHPKPTPETPPLTLSDMPPECRAILNAK